MKAKWNVGPATGPASRWCKTCFYLAALLSLVFLETGGVLLSASSPKTDASVLSPQAFFSEWKRQKDAFARPVRSELKYLGEAVRQYSQNRLEECIQSLRTGGLGASTALQDYFLFFQGSSLKKLRRFSEAQKVFESLIERFPKSPLARTAAVALAENAIDRSLYSEAVHWLDQFDSKDSAYLLFKAKSLLGNQEPESAIRSLEEIYYRMPAAKEASEAYLLLQQLRKRGKYAAPSDPYLPWERISQLLEKSHCAKAYTEAAHQPLPLSAAARNRALLLKGKAALSTRRYTEAVRWLQTIDKTSPEDYPQAQLLLSRLYRQRNLEGPLTQAGRGLRESFPQHPATEEALLQLFDYYYANDRIQEAASVCAEMTSLFPAGKPTQQAHWLIAWNQYRKKDYPAAAQEMEKHLSLFPLSPYRRCASYWLGRTWQNLDRQQQAYAVYRRLTAEQTFDYYGLLARKAIESMPEAMKEMPAGGAFHPDASPSPSRDPNPARDPSAIAASPFPAGWNRFLQLEEAGVFHLALQELEDLQRQGQQENGWYLAKAHIHDLLGQRWDAVRTIVRVLPGYSSLSLDALPRDLWEILYPLEYWEAIQESSQKTRLEPYLVAALIRQESLFQAEARSGANALGLMQILPPTGKELARKLGKPFSIKRLYQPKYNIELGTHYFAELLRRVNGRWDLALAAYNAGPGRVSLWLKKYPNDWDEFVESIPFSETRSYVKNVITHREHYRQLYRDLVMEPTDHKTQ